MASNVKVRLSVVRNDNFLLYLRLFVCNLDITGFSWGQLPLNTTRFHPPVLLFREGQPPLVLLEFRLFNKDLEPGNVESLLPPEANATKDLQTF